MAALDNIASELLKSANEADLIYKKTRDQAQRDKAVRLRRIVENLRQLTFGASDLNGLTDVTISAPANAQVLTYNSTTSQWENQTPAAGGGGDMLKSTYDVDNDGIVDGSETTQIIVRNSTGSTLTKGQVVYLSGATGNRPNAVLSQANTEATSSKTIGIVIANIANNSDGYIAVNGTLHNLDTSAFTAGDAVWLSATTAGAYTSTIPAEPNHTVFIGYVARSHPTQGRLIILIQNGYELNELHGVLISSEANNDLLVYESSSTLWKNKSISTIFGGTPLVSVPTLAQVTTAGNTTTNAIGTGNITVSASNIASLTLLDTLQSYSWQIRNNGTNLLFVNNGGNNLFRINANGNVLIGTNTDAGYKLDVNGTIRSSGTNGLILYDGTYGAKVWSNGYVFTIEKEGTYGPTTYLFKYSDGSSALSLNGTTILGLGGSDDAVMMSRNVYAPASGSFGFTTYGGTTKYKAIQALFTDNNTSGVAFNYKTGGTDTEAMRITSGGSVVIGTTTTTAKFQVNGVTRIQDPSSNSAIVLTYGTGGWIQVIDVGNTEAIRLRTGGASYINTGQNFLIGTTTDSIYRLDVNGTARVSGALTANSFVKTGGTALQYLLADGSVRTTTADTNFVRYGDYITGKNYPGITATLNAQVIRDDFYGFNSRWTQTDTYTGTYPNAGSTWIRTYTLITGENYVYPSGNMYFGFWTNYPPANITVRTWSPTAGVWQGPYTGSDIRIGGGGFAFWKIPIGGNNYVTKFEVTFTPQPGLAINLQSQDLIIDYPEGVDASPIVGRGGSSMYGALSFKTASATNVTINTNGVINLLYLRPSTNTGQIEFQNISGTKAGAMFMDGTIWRFKSQNSSDTLNIFANGNLGIKQTTDAGYTFDVNGTARIQGALRATLANTSTANVVYYDSATGLMTYATAPVGAQFKIDYDPNITGTRNGVNLLFTTSSTFIATTTRVFLNGQRLTRGATYDYVETGTNQITFAVAPVSTDQLIIEYQI